MNSSGMNTATSDRLIETTVKPIWREPTRAARSGGRPASVWRTMFSIITIASSTTKPTEMVSAIREKLSIVNPSAHIPARVPQIDSGTVTAAARVGTSRRMNTSTTSSTSTIVTARVYCTSATLARIVSVRSVTTCRSIPGGIQALSCGSSRRMRSTVSITFASADLVTSSRIAGCLSYQAASRVLVGPSVTRATSARVSTAPRPVFSTSRRYCAAREICPFTPIMIARSGPANPPVGSSTLAPLIAFTTSCADSPAAASRSGSRSIRTAGVSAPFRVTLATPFTCDSRCARMVSAASYICAIGRVFEVSARLIIGIAAGLNLR